MIIYQPDNINFTLLYIHGAEFFHFYLIFKIKMAPEINQFCFLVTLR